MQPVHILLAADANCVVGCAVSMRSILDNASPESPLCFHLLLSGVDGEDRDALVRTATATERAVEVSVRDFDASRAAHLIRSKIITHTAYARLYLHELLPDSVERCIYVDCDVVFERDVRELWELDLGGLCAAAVPNGSREDTLSHQRRLGLAHAAYFNSGVMLMDMSKWRGTQVGPRAQAAAVRVGDRLILHDQDALNCALESDWVPLPLHWNVWVIHPELRDTDRAVRHFMGAPKPWHADYDGPCADRFMHYLDRTEFRGRRPWNPAGLGARIARLRRRIPYLPSVLRLVRLGVEARTKPRERVFAE